MEFGMGMPSMCGEDAFVDKGPAAAAPKLENDDDEVVASHPGCHGSPAPAWRACLVA
jgi:hypothetical protein